MWTAQALCTIFFKITLPYMLFVTTPYLITTFTGNINNFNVIYLLTAGARFRSEQPPERQTSGYLAVQADG